MRIKLDLTSFLGDHRKNSMLLIDPKEQKTVRDVVNRILKLFKIESVGTEGFALFSDDFYLHHDQSSHLLEGCDTLRLSRCSGDEDQAKQKKEKKKRKRKKDGVEEENLDQTLQTKKKKDPSGEEIEGKLDETVISRKKRKKKEYNEEGEEEEEEIFISRSTCKRDQKDGKGHGVTKKKKRETCEEEEEIILVREAPDQQISRGKNIDKKKIANVVEPPVGRSSSSGEESSVKSLKSFSSSEGLCSQGGSSKNAHLPRFPSLTKSLSPKKDSSLMARVALPTQSVICTKSQSSMKSQISSTKMQFPAKESAKKAEATTSEEANVSAVFQADCSEDPLSNQQPVIHSSQDSSSDEIMKVSGSEPKNKRRRKRKHRKKAVRATSDNFINSSTKDDVPPTVLVDQQTASSSNSMQHQNFRFQSLRNQTSGNGNNSYGRTHIIFDQGDDECQIESSKPSMDEGQNIDDHDVEKGQSSAKASVPFIHSTPKCKGRSQSSDMDDISEINMPSDSRPESRIIRRNQETPSTSSNFLTILGMMDQPSHTTPTIYKRPSLRKVDDEILEERPNREEPLCQASSAPPNPVPRHDMSTNKGIASMFHNIIAIENRKVPLVFHHQAMPARPEVPTNTIFSKLETVITKVTKSVAGLTKSESTIGNNSKTEKVFTSHRKLPGVSTSLASTIEDLRTSTSITSLAENASAVSGNIVSSQLSTDIKSQSSPSSIITSSASSSAMNKSESSPKERKSIECEVSQVEVNLCEEGEASVEGTSLKNSSDLQDQCLPLEEASDPENVQEKEMKSCLPQPSSSVGKDKREDSVCQSGDTEEEETPVVDIVSDSEGKSPGHSKSLPYDGTLPPDEAYKRYPLVETLPKKGEYLAVKILKLDENYSPVFSGYLRVEVLKVDGINVTLKYLDKDKSPARKVTSTNEVVDLTFEEDDFYIEQVDWRNIEAPRLLFP